MSSRTTMNQDASASDKKQVDTNKALLDRIEGILSSKYQGDTDGLKEALKKYQELSTKGLLNEHELKKSLETKFIKFSDKQKKDQEKNLLRLEQIQKIAALKDEIAQKKQANQDVSKQEKELAKEEAKLKSDLNKDLAKEAGKQLKNAYGAALNKGIDEYASIMTKYSASIEARLQSGAKNDWNRFDVLSSKVRLFLGSSPFVKQEKMLDSLNELIQKGVNYNIEQRAFLQTMQDKLVTTFDAFDANLLNLIRLQQADSTAARMGMEASLTKSLNSMFKDTSYLTDTFDSVSQALFESISQMGRNEGLEFEYVVQKWLGSLGSVGVGSNTLTQIAAAINALGTGDISKLQSDSAMQNLLVMASNRQGLDYAGLLTQGLNAQSANNLLRGIVDYVREISATENQVVRKQYAELFGVSMSDMVAALNLNTAELDTVQKAMLSYTAATRETQSQLNSVGLRMTTAELIDNLFENTMATAAGTIAGNGATYMLWKAVNKVEDLVGKLEIPFINAMGFGVDLNMGVTEIIKSGITGLSLIGSLVGAIGSIASGGGLNLGIWGAEDTLKRGSGFGGVASGYQVTTSSSTAVVSSSGSDMQEQAVTAASEDANEQLAAAKSEETATEKMLKAIMRAVTGSDDPESGVSTVNVSLTSSGAPLPVTVADSYLNTLLAGTGSSTI